MQEWQDRSLELHRQGLTYNEIAGVLEREFGEGFTHGRVRGFIRRNRGETVVDDSRGITDDSGYKETVKVNADGSVYRDCLIEIMEDVPITPDSILSAHGLQPGLWQVVSYTNNRWHSQSKLQEHIVQYQSKLSAKPIASKVTFDMIDEYFSSHKGMYNYAEKVHNYAVEGLDTLEIDLPDLHSGLLAWREETGEDYDLHIVKERFDSCIDDIAERCKGKAFKKIYFVTLGDLMHIDNDEQKTTKGTFQQADGRTAKIFSCTLDMLIPAIDRLAHYAPVEVVYVCGNHDRTTGYMLMSALKMRFWNDKDITFDITPDPQKYRLIGCNLVGFTHGDMPAKNMRGWLVQRARKEYGLSKHVEIHCGHLHTDKVKEILQTEESEGITIRHLPTICSSSYWEHQQGYSEGTKTVLSFVWNDVRGLRDIWYSNI